MTARWLHTAAGKHHSEEVFLFNHKSESF